MDINNFSNCQRCGKIFIDIKDIKVCEKCEKELDEKLSVVKEYLAKHPGMSVMEISKNTGVKTRLIFTWICQGKLTINVNDDTYIQLHCKGCNKTIDDGYFCFDCAKRFKLSENKQDITFQESKPRMHFLNKKR